MVQAPPKTHTQERSNVPAALRPLKVLHVITRYIGGGAERNTDGTIAWELAAGNEVHLAAGRDADFQGVPSELKTWHIPSLVRNVNPLADLRAIRDLRGLISRHGYDLVHTHTSKAGVVGRLAARGRAGAVVHTVHGASFGPGYSRASSFAFLNAERLCARYSDLLLSVGGELRDIYLDAGVGTPDRFRIVRSTIDVQRFIEARSVTAEGRTAIRHRLAPNATGSVAVMVGLLEPRKRPHLVIERLAPLIRDEGLTLLLAGSGPMEQELRTQARTLGVDDGVVFLGQVAEMPELLAAADVLVHAATAEGVPRVVTEALAAGLPVVATDVVGMREIPGADITIVPTDARGFADHLRTRLAAGYRSPLDASAFAPWTAASVAEQTHAYHTEVRELLQMKGAG